MATNKKQEWRRDGDSSGSITEIIQPSNENLRPLLVRMLWFAHTRRASVGLLVHPATGTVGDRREKSPWMRFQHWSNFD